MLAYPFVTSRYSPGKGPGFLTIRRMQQTHATVTLTRGGLIRAARRGAGNPLRGGTLLLAASRVLLIALSLATALLSITCGDGSPSTPEPPTPAPPIPPPRPPNRAPTVATPIPDVTLERNRPQSFDAGRFFSDPDANRLSYSATTSDPATVGASVTGTEVTLTPLRAGTATVTVTARDPAGLSASQTFTVIVGGGNPPTVSERIPDQVLVAGGSPVLVKLAEHFGDLDRDVLAFEATSSNSAVVRALVADAELVLIPLADGSVTVTVTATDPGGLSATQTFGVAVGRENRPPVAVGRIPDQSLDPGGSAAPRDLLQYFTDPDGDTLTYAAVSSDSAVVRALVAEPHLVLVPAAAGSATVTVTATDPGGLTATHTFEVTVGARNRAPVPTASIPDQTLAFGGGPVEVRLTDYFFDPDGDDLTFQAQAAGIGTVRAVVSGSELILTPVGLATTSVTVTATDPGGLSATQTFEVTVSSENRAPVPLGSIRDRTIALDRNHVRVTFAENFADPDGDDLRFRASSSDEDVVRPVVEGTDVILVPQDVGRATVSVTATDPDGLSAVQRFRVTIYVQPGRTPPTPSGLRVQEAGSNFIVWRWDPVAVATGYDVQFSRDARFAAPLDPVVAVDGTFHRATGVPEGVKAYLRVRTVVRTAGARLESGWSTPVAGMTVGATNTLSTPANLRVTDAGATSIEWTWDEVPGADGYEMQLRRDGNFRQADRVSTVPSTTTIVTRLSNNTEYHIRVRAVADAGATRQRSDWSESVGGRTTPESLFEQDFWGAIGFNGSECPDWGYCRESRAIFLPLEGRGLKVLETPSPNFHIRTHNDDGDERIPVLPAQRMVAMISDTVEALTGQRYQGRITAGPNDLKENDWIVVEFVRDADDPGFWELEECGRARIGVVRGRIWLRSPLPTDCRRLDTVFRHEVGHALGFYHVPGSLDLMAARVGFNHHFTDRERYHAQLAYELGRGRRYTSDPRRTTDTDQGDAAPSFSDEVTTVVCRWR